MRRWVQIIPLVSFMLCCLGCGGDTTVSHTAQPSPQRRGLARMDYSIQVGAFANLDNAVRLSEALERQGLNAYYFVDETGFYKVRFGDFLSKQAARGKAERIREAGIIDEYYLVSPDDYAALKYRRYNHTHIRDEIVKTAKRFIGVPYRWGGSSPDVGFDCSGLTMTVYRLNGLNLPRSSRAQYRVGSPISRSKLSQGDLVFFATASGRRVSHVGIYTGGGKFVHAPKKGKKIRTESLTNSYFRSRYVGARTYLN